MMRPEELRGDALAGLSPERLIVPLTITFRYERPAGPRGSYGPRAPEASEKFRERPLPQGRPRFGKKHLFSDRVRFPNPDFMTKNTRAWRTVAGRGP